ncbi:MAG: hypothetical protein ACK4GN_14445 [Runella sp.]
MKKIFSISILICFFSCTENKNDQYAKQIDEILRYYHFENLAGKKIFIITSLEVCGACLDYTVKFIEKNIEDSNYLFIISSSSIKKTKITFTPKVLESPHFLLDSQLVAVRKGLVNTEKPQAYLFSNGKVVDVQQITYSNADSIFRYIHQFLNSQP